MCRYCYNLFTMASAIDATDRRLIDALRQGARSSVTELARTTRLARGTVHNRLARLVDDGVIIGWGPELAPEATGYTVVAFVTLSIVQGTHDSVIEGLRDIPEVLEVHVVTGSGDLLCRIAARSNDHLHDIIQTIISVKGVARSDSHLALNTPITRSLADLVSEKGV